MTATRDHRRSDSVARAIFDHVLPRIRGGTIEVTDAWGAARVVAAARAGEPALCARVTVHEPRLYTRLLREGSVGLGESYADGWWDTDDLPALLRLALRGLTRTHPALDRAHRVLRPVVDPIARLRRGDKHRDAANVRAHYDVGNDLFERVLDETMMYSCGVFASPADSLATASIAKLDRIATMLRLAPGDRVLEIGTGWGGFAVHAATRYGCQVTTTTISERQYAYASRRVHDAGLADRVCVRNDDYRDLQGTFDKIVAIEMIEAVDWREYDAYFARLRALLTDDGVVGLQAIVVPDHSFDRTKHHTDFIKAAIFPGGSLPSVGALTRSARRAGLGLAHLDDIGMHYAETLRWWRANLADRRAELSTLGFADRFLRLWDFYFAYCEAGFDERAVSVAQLAYASPGWQRDALRIPTRDRRQLSMA